MYKEWEAGVSEALRGDALWTVTAYRYALYLADVAWSDVGKLMQDRRTALIAGQLYRAAGSVGANLAEGYSRGSNRERAHFYKYSLGSAREARDWYFKARHVLGESVLDERLRLLTEIIRLLLSMIPRQRGSRLYEEEGSYDVEGDAAGTLTEDRF